MLRCSTNYTVKPNQKKEREQNTLSTSKTEFVKDYIAYSTLASMLRRFRSLSIQIV